MSMMIRRNKMMRRASQSVSPQIVEKKENNVAVAPVPVPIVEEIAQEQKKYSRSDIMTMSTSNLQLLAAGLGIENAMETSGNKLKPIIIKELGL